MQAVLVDTDVFSFVFKRDTRAKPYELDLVGSQACLCFQSVAELRLWTLVRRWGEKRRQTLDSSISKCVVLPYDNATSQHWAEITDNRRKIGQPISCGDAWIAATALRHDLTLLTHNAGDYSNIPGLKTICHSAPQF